ncbi:MAG: spermidine/putrescine ABC transporter substrate-binding protein [Clostridiales bacterium]|nr:spermidine/putrescine ABC transporter substrate-binding protein [Clostridiales bacterium]
MNLAVFKRVLSAVLVLILSFAVSSCSGGKNELYVYNWGDYIDTEILTEFEAQTGIKVIYDTFDSNETMYTKLKPGSASYDIAVPSDYMFEKMKNEGMLEKINFDNIPNYKYIADRFKGMHFDTDNEYFVTYMWGTVGILYNTEMVTEPVDSWDILWDEKYAGQIFMYDSQRDALATSLKRLGFSLNTTDLNELTLAKMELIKQKPLVQAYLGDPVKDKMIGGEGAMAVVYSGDAMFSIGENESLAYAVPKEGTNIWMDGIVIPKGAKNKENAEKFINFLCDPAIAAKNTEYIGFSTPNSGALELIPEDMKNDPTYWPSEESLANCEMFFDLGSFIEEYDKAWTEVLAASN